MDPSAEPKKDCAQCMLLRYKCTWEKKLPDGTPFKLNAPSRWSDKAKELLEAAVTYDCMLEALNQGAGSQLELPANPDAPAPTHDLPQRYGQQQQYQVPDDVQAGPSEFGYAGAPQESGGYNYEDEIRSPRGDKEAEYLEDEEGESSDDGESGHE
ncbi:hypothetical protein PG994_013579 [Apiospora phragmitis]|uniref:Uncharacterized protein n=1 Tax=Apiospora phragmitis TaxID=2905665 RepID=A0ABR1T914_9PEZI